MGKTGEQIGVVFIAIIGVAALAVVLSKNANTSAVISAATTGFSQSLAAALSPITGGSTMGSFGGI